MTERYSVPSGSKVAYNSNSAVLQMFHDVYGYQRLE